MDSGPTDADADADARGKEAVVNLAWQTDGMINGAFDGPHYCRHASPIIPRRPRSSRLWTLRIGSFTIAVGSLVATIAYTLITLFTVSSLVWIIVVGLALCVVSYIAYLISYALEKRGIASRIHRDRRARQR